MITQEELKQILHYDPSTGVFTRKVRTPKQPVGTIVGTVKGDGYRSIGINYVYYPAHHLAWLYEYGCFPKGVVDHIDGDKDNNAINNLRDVSQRENNQNRVYHRSGDKLPGVSYEKNGYKARFTVESVSYNIGRFPTEEEAHNQYCMCCESPNPKEFIDSWRKSRNLAPIWN